MDVTAATKIFLFYSEMTEDLFQCSTNKPPQTFIK